MKRLMAMLGLLATVAMLGGCAHPISLNPNLSSVVGSGSGKIDKAAGLSVAPDLVAREVIGPGGGGDKVSYFPYRDLEAGLYVALGETFGKVARVNGRADPKVAAEGLNYIVTPSISTTSHSPSLFTWPPTIFTIEINGRIEDPQGKVVAEVRANGEGRAEFDEFKADASLSAKRAAEDVLKKFVKALDAAKAALR